MPDEEKSTRPVSDEPSQPDAALKPKKKKGFLSFLCCGSSGDASDPTLEDQPNKPVTRTNAERTSQSVPTPADQSAISAGPRAGNKAGSSLDDPSAQQGSRTTSEKPLSAEDLIHKPVPDLPAEANESSLGKAQSNGQQSTVTSPGIVPLVLAPAPDADASSGPSVEVQPPTPIGGAIASEDIPIADRTPAQKAQDDNLELVDSGPKVPLSEHEAEIITHQQQPEPEVAQAPTLPPPPPIVDRGVDGSVNSREGSESAQKWLLPPMRPEHRGRKCLVLDLDETLVHSSFKVHKFYEGENWLRHVR
jgi:RNA polymerase II subunit A small phosphatase-like protein